MYIAHYSRTNSSSFAAFIGLYFLLHYIFIFVCIYVRYGAGYKINCLIELPVFITCCLCTDTAWCMTVSVYLCLHLRMYMWTSLT